MNDNGNDNGEVHPADAARALLARGIDNPDELLAYGTPAQIVEACNRWDRRHGVGPGLLASWIRNGEFTDPGPAIPPPSKAAVLRARFDAYARRYPEGAVTETHVELGARRWADEQIDCSGRLVVYDVAYPVIAVECDACGFTVAYPVRGLHVLGPPLEAVTATDQPQNSF